MTDPLTTVFRAAQTGLAQQLETAMSAAREHDARREVQEITDTFLIRACQHVSAVCDVVLPLASSQLRNGSAIVDEYVDQAKHLEQAIAHTKRRLYGEIHSVSAPWDSVLGRLVEEYQRLADLELLIVDRLAESNQPPALTDIAAKFIAVVSGSPTRPHPHSPHVGRLAHLTRSLWSRADRFWDAAESRVSTAVTRRLPAS